MVSSPVSRIEELLDRIYAFLTGLDTSLDVHKGTLPVFSNRSAFENCIAAVEDCDLFLGIITPTYGSGRDGDGISISHQELRRAIELNKPRWLLVHDHVVLSRLLLKYLGYTGGSGRSRLSLDDRCPIMDDLRVIDMFEEATLSQTPLEERQGNWVQMFRSEDEALLFATAQFSRYQEVEAFIQENFSETERVSRSISERGSQ